MNGQQLQDDGLCFGCGANNRIGLHLRFEWDGDTCGSFWTPKPEHQGWADRVHGGLLHWFSTKFFPGRFWSGMACTG